jgi:hypothetical protein
VSVLVERVTVTVSDEGLDTDPCTVDPALLVISTRDRAWAVPEAKVSVRDGMTSVPDVVWNVKVSDVVALPPGASVTDGVSVPLPKITPADPGMTGLLGRFDPVDQLPLLSCTNILK